MTTLAGDSFVHVPADRAAVVGYGGGLTVAVCRPVDPKFALDFVAALLGLVMIAPFLIIVAVAIVLDSKGPVFFRQTRTGIDGKPFKIFKFRTMRVQEDGHVVTQAKVGRQPVTRVGRFLRKTSIDELPQLINVLRGEMSLVGPRPHALAHDQFYGREIPAYKERFAVRPGLTGWAQVQGSAARPRPPPTWSGGSPSTSGTSSIAALCSTSRSCCARSGPRSPARPTRTERRSGRPPRGGRRRVTEPRDDGRGLFAVRGGSSGAALLGGSCGRRGRRPSRRHAATGVVQACASPGACERLGWSRRPAPGHASVRRACLASARQRSEQ